jgi:hypothetical protein
LYLASCKPSTFKYIFPSHAPTRRNTESDRLVG